MPIGIGAPEAIGGASGGYTIAINNLSTTPQVVLPIDPGRVNFMVHNPGSVDAFVAQQFTQGTGSDAALTPSPTSLGGCWRVYANGGTLLVSGECQKSWQAFSLSGSANPLTIQVSRT